MSPQVKDVMTTNPVCLNVDAPVMDAAKAMRDQDIGNVVITRDKEPTGIITDRDIVVRTMAENHDPNTEQLGAFATSDPICVSEQTEVQDAVKLMRDHHVRRLPVCTAQGETVGIVSLGDLAVERDPESVLADISQGQPNL